MSRMPDDVYNRYYKMVRDWSGDKDSLQRFYDSQIKWKYDDWEDMIDRIDKYQTKWTMNLR